jgi:hypothetical protein
MAKDNMTDLVLELYAVMNKDGQWFRAKGYGGCGASWVDDIKKARIYPKIGPAKARVTYFASHYPDYGIPKIVKLIVTDTEIIDTEKEYKENQKKKEIATAKYIAKQKEKHLKEAEQRLKEAQEKYENLLKEDDLIIYKK